MEPDWDSSSHTVCRTRFLSLPTFTAATLEGHFEEVCECLKRNKITARWVLLSQIGLTREQCVTLLRILKPAKAVMNSEGSNRFETLLLSKTLVGLFSPNHFVLVL